MPWIRSKTRDENVAHVEGTEEEVAVNRSQFARYLSAIQNGSQRGVYEQQTGSDSGQPPIRLLVLHGLTLLLPRIFDELKRVTAVGETIRD